MAYIVQGYATGGPERSCFPSTNGRSEVFMKARELLATLMILDFLPFALVASRFRKVKRTGLTYRGMDNESID